MAQEHLILHIFIFSLSILNRHLLLVQFEENTSSWTSSRFQDSELRYFRISNTRLEYEPLGPNKCTPVTAGDAQYMFTTSDFNFDFNELS